MIEFKVIRTETATRQCVTCGGVGKLFRKTKHGTFAEQCHASGCQNGKYTIEHRTETNLLDALKELGLIK